MRFQDQIQLPGVDRRGDWLVAMPVVARTGIQLYDRSELPLTAEQAATLGGGPVRVYRPASEVMNADSLHSYSHAPVTLDHPSELVTAENWSDLAKGEMGEDANWENGRLRIPIVIKAADAIKAVQDGVRELSAGYTCDLEWTSGTTPQGEAYDAIQRNIRINHVAIVPRGRAGVAVLGDADAGKDRATWGASPLPQADTKGKSMSDLLTVVVGDKAVQVSAADAATLDAFKDAAAKALSDAQTAHAQAIAAKDAEIANLTAAKDAAEAKAKDAALSPQKLAEMVRARKAVADKAVALGLDADKVEEMSEEDMKAEAVKKKMGDKAAAYTDAQFSIAFDMLDAPTTADALKAGLKPVPAPATLDTAYQDRNARLAGAWKKEA